MQISDQVDGPECDFTYKTSGNPLPTYYSPADADAGLYYNIRFSDGAYARIPKSFSHEKVNDEAWIGMEFGCLTQSGDFHRLLAMGSREEGGLHTTVYERWGHQNGY